jgi:hypothetical protein
LTIDINLFLIQIEYTFKYCQLSYSSKSFHLDFHTAISNWNTWILLRFSERPFLISAIFDLKGIACQDLS